MANPAQLELSAILTDGSTLDVTVAGVLTSYAKYDVTLTASDGTLPDGTYSLQIWYNLTLLAGTDQAGSTSITVSGGEGTGVLSTETDEAQTLVESTEQATVVLLLYDSNGHYLPARTKVTFIRNEAGEEAGNLSLVDDSTITGAKTFEQFPTGPQEYPTADWEFVNKSYVDAYRNLTVQLMMSGNGSALTTGVKGEFSVPYDATISSAKLLADQVSTVTVDIWQSTWDEYGVGIPSDEDSITGGNEVSLSSAIKSEDSTLTGWTTEISQGDILRLNIDANDVAARLTVILEMSPRLEASPSPSPSPS